MSAEHYDDEEEAKGQRIDHNTIKLYVTSQVVQESDNSKILDVSQVQEEERCTKPIETLRVGSNLKLRKSAFVLTEELELEWKTMRYSIKSDNIV